MFRVQFTEARREVTVDRGTTILDAARKAGLDMDSPCNQTGVCGKCRVRLDPESLARVISPDHATISLEQRAEGWCLACHSTIAGDIVVIEITAAEHDNGAVLQHGQSAALSHAPFFSKHFVLDDNRTLIYAGQQQAGTETGDTSHILYGAAVDIGTTTLVVSLVDLQSGREAASASAHNPQAKYAQDVLSRISCAGTAEGLLTLQQTLMAVLNSMLAELAGQVGIGTRQIYELVFSGNTCMLHLATGHSPKSLGRYPYTPKIYGHESMDATALGLHISPHGQVYLPPILSPFVGADITSGILSLQLHRLAGISLLVDIGTNGEIVLADNGRLTATSTAAGPALEGMNISCGMCAGPGAVERVASDSSGAITFSTIGDKAAGGLCGSGLIDLVAALIDLRVIEANGRFASPEKLAPDLAERLARMNGSVAFALTPEVCLSQKDVRQVQLAKGAIQAGMEFLLRHTGIGYADVDRVMIAGAFGYHLATDSLVRLKIIPEELAGKIAYVGNTSKTGSQTFLTNVPCREEMAQVASAVEIVELSGQRDFERLFVSCLSF